MKEIVRFAIAGSAIINVLSSEDFSAYKGMHWHEGIVDEVRSHCPGQNIEVKNQYDDTGGVAAIILVLKS